MDPSTETMEVKDRLEHAEEELEAKKSEVETLAAEVVAETIEAAQSTATAAVEIATDTNRRLENVADELEHHEEADQWMQMKLDELTLTTSTLSSAMESLSNRLALLETPPAPTPEPETVSDTTRTEVLPSVAVESPAAEPAPTEPEPKRRHVRMV